MVSGWELPTKVHIGARQYEIHGDFRDILEIIAYLDDPALPEYMRWEIALKLFYEGEIPHKHRQEAAAYLSLFLNCGKDTCKKSGAKLLDWQQDAPLIVADVNKVAGQEIRALPFVHWWTFMAWFHAIGEGQLSSVVAIRDKLLRGKKLEQWEKDFYRENKDRVELSRRYSPEELEEQERLKKQLNR